MKTLNIFATSLALLVLTLSMTACGNSGGSSQVPDTARLGALDRNAPEARKLVSGAWCSDGRRTKRYTFAENGELFITHHSQPRRHAASYGFGPGQFNRGTWGLVTPRLFIRMPELATTFLADFSHPRVIVLQSEPGSQFMQTVKLRRCGPSPYRN